MDTKQLVVAPQQEDLKVVCAWCPNFNPKDESNRNVSHGICPSCAAKFESGSR